MFRDFSQFYNPLHGNCYVFNSGWNSSVKPKTSTKSGRLHGEEITVSVYQCIGYGIKHHHNPAAIDHSAKDILLLYKLQ